MSSSQPVWARSSPSQVRDTTLKEVAAPAEAKEGDKKKEKPEGKKAKKEEPKKEEEKKEEPADTLGGGIDIFGDS